MNGYGGNSYSGYGGGSQNQLINGSFVIVPNETSVLSWPIAPGTSMTFKIENAPFLYTKMRGTSPFDQPIIKRYRLVEENLVQDTGSSDPQPQTHQDEYVLKTDFQKLMTVIRSMQDEMALLKGDSTAMTANLEGANEQTLT